MATTNWPMAMELDQRFPNAFLAMQELILAMETAAQHAGHVTWYGKDMALITRLAFEDKLKGVLQALVADSVVVSQANPQEYRVALSSFLQLWFRVFPNWPEVVEFVEHHLEADQQASQRLIARLLGLAEDFKQ